MELSNPYSILIAFVKKKYSKPVAGKFLWQELFKYPHALSFFLTVAASQNMVLKVTLSSRKEARDDCVNLNRENLQHVLPN